MTYRKPPHELAAEARLISLYLLAQQRTNQLLNQLREHGMTDAEEHLLFDMAEVAE